MAQHKASNSHRLGKRQAVIVLGMHRSGTSALTGMLGISGVAMPSNQIEAGAQNERGFFEAKPIARLNDDLLRETDRVWDDWRPVSEGDQDTLDTRSFFERAQKLIEAEFGNAALFAIKDPRICRLIPFWVEFLNTHDVQPFILHTHRHPMEVAQSLQKRNDLTLSHGLLLWLSYVLNAEAETRDLKRVFTSFDQVINEPVNTLARIESDLRLRFPRQPADMATQISEFISADLRHHVESDTDTLPKMVRTVFEILDRWANTGEEPRDHDELDRIKRLFFHVISDQNDPQILWRALDQSHTDASSGGAKMESWLKPDLLKFISALQRTNAALNQELDLEVSQAQASQTEFLSKLENRDRELGLLAQLLHQAESTAQEQEACLKKAQTELGDAIADKTAALDKAGRIDIEMQSAKEKILQSNQFMKTISAENEDLRQRAERAEFERQAIAESTIWRATAPIRKTLNLLQRRR